MPPPRTQRSDRAKQYRAWYSTPQWCALRSAAIDRAIAHGSLACALCGVGFGGKARVVADHIVPHRGDVQRFFALDNIQLLCAPCHDGAKQSEERRGYSTAVGDDGWPLDERHPSNAGR